MARSPGILNPLSFDSDEEFEAALEAQGKASGWRRLMDWAKPETPKDALNEANERRG